MSKTHRDIEQTTILSGERFSHPSTMSRRSPADIHRDVEDFTVQNGYQFSLSLRMLLIMQASENSPTRMRIVILHKGIVDPIGRKRRSLVALYKKAALIFERLSVNQDHIWNF
jgi:hypothetical protein